ncbi:MAG: hypothetical protein ACYC35_23345 [Pirellulales bacterium]
MRRHGLLVFVVLGISGLAGPVEANWFADAWASVCRDFKRNNCWPDTFIPTDRQAVRAPNVIMIANGWRRQNTLFAYHFEEGAAKLTEAGRLKIKAILTQTPPEYLAVFVQRADTSEITLARIDAVQQTVARMAPEGGELPPVLETLVTPPGRPAAYNKTIADTLGTYKPTPWIQGDSGSGGGGGGGGGGTP